MQIEESTLDQIRSRPRFRILTDLSREQHTALLERLLQEKSVSFRGTVNSEMATIHVNSSGDPYWKPCLSLRTEHDEQRNRTVIFGVFGPSSAVWTFFMFLYFIFGILWMVFFTLWYVEKQIKSNDFPWALSVSFVMLLLLLATFSAVKVGQYKARGEMRKLREFAEESVKRQDMKGF